MEVAYVKCKRCGRVQYPRARCVECRGGDFEEVRPDWKEGKLLSFTFLYVLPERVKSEAPYMLGVAEFNGVRAFGVLKGEKFRVGMRVRAKVDVFGEVDGKPACGLVFLPEE